MSVLPASGTRDFSPREARIRRYVIDRLCKTAESYAFQPIETPAFERIELLDGKYGEENEKLLFKILKRGDKASSGECDLVLRYDLTVPAMRYYARHRRNLPKLFKRYQYGPVWRADRPARNRYREFHQFDFDIYGRNSVVADAECMNMITASLHALGISNFRIRLNSRKLLTYMMREFHIPADLYTTILTIVDKTDKIGIDGLVECLGPYSEVGRITELTELFRFPDYNEAIIDRLRSTDEYVDEISQLDRMVTLTGHFTPRPEISVDMTLARGLDYYTGIIYEFEMPGIKGSIAGGGRYDSLSRLFMKDSVPVCGSSLGIDRIVSMVEPEPDQIDCTPDIYIATETSEEEFLCRLAYSLRNGGFSVEAQCEGDTAIGKQLSYASRLGARYFMYRGTTERQQGAVLIKRLSDSEQFFVPAEQVLETMRRLA